MRSPSSRARPFKKSSSIRKVNPTTSAPWARTSLAAAAAVPPVASTSSTTRTRSPALTASLCISSASVPYSRAYSTRPRSAGSFPGFRIGTSPASSASAIGAPSRKPRDSIETARDLGAPGHGRHQLDSAPECGRVEQQRRDVLEYNPRLGEIRDIPDIAGDVLDGHGHGLGQWESLQLVDFEVVRQFHIMWNLGSFHTVDPCARRSPGERSLQSFKCFLNPLSNHFNRAIGEVAHAASQCQPLGLPPHEPAIPHALHATANQETHRRHGAYSPPRCATRRRCHQT